MNKHPSVLTRQAGHTEYPGGWITTQLLTVLNCLLTRLLLQVSFPTPSLLVFLGITPYSQIKNSHSKLGLRVRF